MKPKDILALRTKKLLLTQRELAVKLKVHWLTISKWERGITKPGLQSIRKLNRLASKGGR